MNPLSSTFGAVGISAIKIGNTVIPIAAPKTRTTLKGYGDTIKVGDIAYWDVIENGKVTWSEGPFRVEAISGTEDPWFSYLLPSGRIPSANYVGDTWRRSFRKADKETAKKVRAALKFFGLHVRLNFAFKYDIERNSSRSLLIPACWIAWVGDLQKAFMTADTAYGKLKKKNIVRWIKNRMFTDFTMKSKVPIPDDFPVSLE